MTYLKYCDCRSSNTMSCAQVATFRVIMQSKKSFDKMSDAYRCELHKNTGTVSKKAFDIQPFDQSELIIKLTLRPYKYV